MIPLFHGILQKHSCSIYRLVNGYDSATADFGEIEEEWGLVTENIHCLLDANLRPIRLNKGGLQEVYTETLYVDGDVGIRLYDRVVVNDCLVTPNRAYSVDAINHVFGYNRNEKHHIECSVSAIDWDIPTAGTWEPITLSYVFTFETTSPMLIMTVSPDSRILRVGLEIETAFNGTDTLRVGTASTTLMGITENIPTSVGYYETAPVYETTESTPVYLYIVSGSSTQGSGRVHIEVEGNG